MDNDSEKINWDLITQDKAEFILSQSEKCLESSLQNTDSIDRKAFIILAGLFSFISAMIILSLTKDINIVNLLIIVFMLIGFGISSAFCLRSLEIKTIYLIGNTPNNLLRTKHSGHDYLRLLQCELLSNEAKILKSTSVNEMKGDKLNNAIKGIQFTLAISILSIPIFLFYPLQGQSALVGEVGAFGLNQSSDATFNSVKAHIID